MTSGSAAPKSWVCFKAIANRPRPWSSTDASRGHIFSSRTRSRVTEISGRYLKPVDRLVPLDRVVDLATIEAVIAGENLPAAFFASKFCHPFGRYSGALDSWPTTQPVRIHLN